MFNFRFISPLMRRLAVAGLAVGLLASALAAPTAFAAQAASAASASPQRPLLAQAVAPVAAPVSAPLAATITATVGCTATYTIQPGDTLWRIGLKYGVEWPQIAAKNGLANPGLIFAGQSLCLPEAGTVPVSTTTPTAPSATPTIEVLSVVADQSVTFKASNFPANKSVDVRMGKNGTLGVGGTLVTTVNAGSGVFTGTYTIPAALKGQPVIALRLESQWGGYYSYNWFYNSSTK